jgi:hypothetical protein
MTIGFAPEASPHGSSVTRTDRPPSRLLTDLANDSAEFRHAGATRAGRHGFCFQRESTAKTAN